MKKIGESILILLWELKFLAANLGMLLKKFTNVKLKTSPRNAEFEAEVIILGQEHLGETWLQSHQSVLLVVGAM